MTTETLQFVVKENIREAEDVATLKLFLPHTQPLAFVPGQFITVYFPELGTPEGKAYSISSAPGEETVSITVKGIGEFSHRLCAMRRGDAVVASRPYGYFYSESPDTPLVLAAAGIGIAPFHSMILHEVREHPSRRIALWYSSQTVGGGAFAKELANLAKRHAAFTMTRCITREKKIPRSFVGRRMTAQDLCDASHAQSEFFLCGSVSFVGDMWKGLRELGVPEEKIYTEAFFSSANSLS